VLKDDGDGGARGGVVLGRRWEAELLQHAADEVRFGSCPLPAVKEESQMAEQSQQLVTSPSPRTAGIGFAGAENGSGITRARGRVQTLTSEHWQIRWDWRRVSTNLPLSRGFNCDKMGVDFAGLFLSHDADPNVLFYRVIAAAVWHGPVVHPDRHLF
jgi:hypothetical protein